ncbi:spore germination protein GerPC [Tumebacillus sp. BK434]|uniref:spore germination protein GerPC n=1 Tax=Tumebacillus sp. BK434 TaxID=2512169 RepID=UPI00140460EA|nr:spore germination protein GerPC [Tumebacillus sp. BK434]
MWDVWQALQQLEARIRRLEAENVELRQQLKAGKRPLKVKKIVYHVHSLHIQEMKGTMNLGISAPLPEEEMEQFRMEMQKQQD